MQVKVVRYLGTITCILQLLNIICQSLDFLRSFEIDKFST